MNVDKINDALLIIYFGLLILAIQFGFLASNIWFQLLRLWPIILVAVGIDWLVRTSKFYWLKISSSLLIIVSSFVLIWYIQGGKWLNQGELKTYYLSQSIISTGAAGSKLNFNFSQGNFRLGNATEQLIEGDYSSYLGLLPEISFDTFSGSSIFSINQSGKEKFLFGPWDNNHNWDFKLNNSIPTEIKIKSNLANNDWDFSNLPIKSLKIETDTSYSKIKLPSEVIRVDIKANVSNIILILPSKSGIKIKAGFPLFINNFSRLGFYHSDNIYTSSTYEELEKKIYIEIVANFSNVKIEPY